MASKGSARWRSGRKRKAERADFSKIKQRQVNPVAISQAWTDMNLDTPDLARVVPKFVSLCGGTLSDASLGLVETVPSYLLRDQQQDLARGEIGPLQQAGKGLFPGVAHIHGNGSDVNGSGGATGNRQWNQCAWLEFGLGS